MARPVHAVAICLTNMKITNDNCRIALSIKKSHGFHQSLKLVFEKVTSSKLYVSQEMLEHPGRSRAICP